MWLFEGLRFIYVCGDFVFHAPLVVAFDAPLATGNTLLETFEGAQGILVLTDNLPDYPSYQLRSPRHSFDQLAICTLSSHSCLCETCTTNSYTPETQLSQHSSGLGLYL